MTECGTQCSVLGNKMGIWNRLNSVVLEGLSSLDDSSILEF